jgi:short-subunit dehydrogenase
VKATIFGASGGLATEIAYEFLRRDWDVHLVTRDAKRERIAREVKEHPKTSVTTVAGRYSGFVDHEASDAYFFTQALFEPKPLVKMNADEIQREIEVGLTDVVQLTSKLLGAHPDSGSKRDYCFIGSTSSYAGFKNTSVYCAVKHGLLGFVRALNDEYSGSNVRFWLFSMGTMNTEMGRRLTDQDSATFLQPKDVAQRIVEAIASPSNIFEPEVILRRRTIRFLEK